MAPADRSAEADGDGGGSTTEPCRCLACVGVPVGFRGEPESPVALPGSEPPSGIWTVNRGPRGRAPPVTEPAVLLVRAGGGKVASGIDGLRGFSSEL